MEISEWNGQAENSTGHTGERLVRFCFVGEDSIDVHVKYRIDTTRITVLRKVSL